MLTRDKSREDNLHFRTDGYGRKDVKAKNEGRERGMEISLIVIKIKIKVEKIS